MTRNLQGQEARPTGDMLVACAAQHGVHGVAHLVEEVLHHARREQCGGALGGMGQAQHQHHYRQLVIARRLATAPAPDGEVAVLWRVVGMDSWERELWYSYCN